MKSVTYYDDTFDKIYFRKVEDILFNGSTRNVRGFNTLELLASQIVVPMMDPILRLKSRKLNYKFMFAEALWIITGRNDVDFFTGVMENIKRFSDDGAYFNGAYGPKIVDQLPYITSCFKEDIFTRQAVINIWREKPGKSKDIPCTLSLQFLIRENLEKRSRLELDCVATMRSSDMYLGLPYDVFNFSALSLYVSKLLEKTGCTAQKITLGNLYLTAGSQHIYKENKEKLVELSKSIQINNLHKGSLNSDYFIKLEFHPKPFFDTTAFPINTPEDVIHVLKWNMDNFEANYVKTE